MSKTKYSKEESLIYMKDLQNRLDKQGKTIRFIDLFIKTKPLSISHTIGTALNLHPTCTTGGKLKKEHNQDLGSSRSLQDLYLIVKHYFPEATIFDVVSDLQKRIDDSKIGYFFCSTYNRWMFAKGHSNPYPFGYEILSRYGFNV